MIHQQYKDDIINALARENAELRADNAALRGKVGRLRNRLAPFEEAANRVNPLVNCAAPVPCSTPS